VKVAGLREGPHVGQERSFACNQHDDEHPSLMVNEHGCAVLAEREARLGNSHKSVGAGDGGPRLHERKRTGGLVVWLSAGLAFAGSRVAFSSSKRAAAGWI